MFEFVIVPIIIAGVIVALMEMAGHKQMIQMVKELDEEFI